MNSRSTAIALALIACPSAVLAGDATPRHRAPVTAYRKTHPCPSTGLTDGACPGFVVDHIVPLCWGGADDPINMSWEEVQESYRKDVFERAACKLRDDFARCRVPLE